MISDKTTGSGKALELNDISVSLGGTPIVHSITMELSKGDIGCLLGPSGCGKTTLLRAIAGFEPVTSGQIQIAGDPVSQPGQLLPVEKRQVGMVFQDYALFPHLSIRDNIAFGLKGWSRKEKEKRVNELAAMLHIDDLLDAYSHRLSGGQQQRVAIARAMAPRPRILLLDEPFASLDVELREQIAAEIRLILKADGITTILVSHNQLEAFAMADVIGVMRSGELMQWGNAFSLYHEPASAYVANFIGEGVFLPGTVLDNGDISTELGILPAASNTDPTTSNTLPGQRLSVLVRPDDVLHDDESEFTAKVLSKAFRGASYLYTLALPSGAQILSLVPSHHNHEVGSQIGIHMEMDHLVTFPQA